MGRFIFIFFLSIFFSELSFAQDKKYVYEDSTLQQPETVSEVDTVLNAIADDVVINTQQKITEDNETDTTLLFNKLGISRDSLESWKNSRAFLYAKNLDSLLMEMKKKDAVKIDKPVYTGPSFFERFIASPVTRIVFWVLAGIFVLFIIYKLFLADGIFKRSARENSVIPLVEEEKFTPESDFDSFIRQAVASANYRLAIRYQYLKSLHLLAAKNWVQLAADKTNYQYVREIKNYDYQNGFSQLTLNYEYVWYGEFAIEESIYARLQAEFTDFNKKI